jgi:hypothetical protein
MAERRNLMLVHGDALSAMYHKLRILLRKSPRPSPGYCKSVTVLAASMVMGAIDLHRS